MADPSGTTLALIATVSFCVSALCSLAKSAQVCFSPAKLEAMLTAEKARDKLRQFVSRSSQILIAVIILGSLANMMFVLAVTLFFTSDGSISNVHLLYGIILSFGPLLIFGKAIPESLGRLQPEKIMLWVIPFSRLTYWLLWWLVSPVYWMTKKCAQSLGEMPQAALAAAFERAILHVVSEGQKEGVLEESEKDMIAGVIELKDSEVHEVMTPRTDMISIPLETSIQEAISIAIEEGHSRIPIYRENRDDIVGILFVKDVLKHWNDENRHLVKIETLIHKPYFIPETKHIGSLLRDFQQQKVHMSIVLDEYGGTAGIVTIEDIIEEIVGEILDEYDDEIHDPIRRIAENELEVDARVRVDELNEELQVELPVDDGYETVGGFLCSYLGHIPKKDEIYHYQNLQFVVLDASERRINRVKVVRHEAQE